MNTNLLMLSYELDYLHRILVEKADGFTESAFTSAAELLLDMYYRKVNEAYQEVKELDNPSGKDIERIFERKIKIEFPFSVTGELSNLLAKFYREAKKRKSKLLNLETVFGEKDLRSIEWLQNYTNFWIKNYYDRIAGEEVTAVIREGLNRFKTTSEIADMLREKLKDRISDSMIINNKQYWEGVVRNAVTRARTTADLRTIGVVARYYVIDATEDSRTCDICRTLDGRVIEVEQGEQSIRLFESLKTPEDVKRKYPWVHDKKEVLKPVKDMKKSHLLPPFHFNCRCVINEWTGGEPEILDEFPRIDILEPEQTAELCVNYEKFMNARTEEELRRFGSYITRSFKLPVGVKFSDIREYGYYDPVQRIITVSTRAPRILQYETLIHESIHAYCDVKLKASGSAMDEVQAEFLSSYIMSHIKPFPWPVAYNSKIFKALVGFVADRPRRKIKDFARFLWKGLNSKEDYDLMTSMLYDYSFRGSSIYRSDPKIFRSIKSLINSKKFKRYQNSASGFGKKYLNDDESMTILRMLKGVDRLQPEHLINFETAEFGFVLRYMISRGVIPW